MKIKSFGCSFIFGSELADDRKDLPVPLASNLTWPALLAKHHKFDYECLARPGSGNLQIAERVLSHCEINEPCYFVIGWSWIDRFDYTNSTISTDSIQSQWTNWNTIMPVDTDDLAKTYYKELHSEFRDKLTTLMSVKLVIDTLNQKRIPFLMTYMDELMFDQRWNITPAVRLLQNQVFPCMTDFEGCSFLQWSRKKQFPISSTMHPLELAHQAAAEYMITVFDTQKTSDPVQQVRV